MSFSYVQVCTLHGSTISVKELFEEFDVYSDIEDDVSVEVFRGVIALDGRLTHCGDYVRLSSDHYHVSSICDMYHVCSR